MSESDSGCAWVGITLIILVNLAFWGLIAWGLVELILLISRS